MTGDWLFERMAQTPEAIALATPEGETTYQALLERVAAWDQYFADNDLYARVLSIEGDYGVESIALFLAAMKARNIIIPICSATRDGLCSVCPVRLRPHVFQQIRQNDSIIQCDSCQRVLYWIPPPPPVEPPVVHAP